MDERAIGLSSPRHCVLTDWDVMDVQNGSSCPVYQSVKEIKGYNINML